MGVCYASFSHVMETRPTGARTSGSRVVGSNLLNFFKTSRTDTTYVSETRESHVVVLCLVNLLIFFLFLSFGGHLETRPPALTHTTFRGQCHRLRGGRGRSRQVFSFARNSFSLDGTFFVFWISSLSFGRHAVTFSSRPFSAFPLGYVFAFFYGFH